jgi:hypothetical protein
VSSQRATHGGCAGSRLVTGMGLRVAHVLPASLFICVSIDQQKNDEAEHRECSGNDVNAER